MENGRLNKNKYFSGFSLIEALVTVVIFSLTFIAFMSFSSYGVKITQSSQERTNANLIANMILEDIQIDIDNIDSIIILILILMKRLINQVININGNL